MTETAKSEPKPETLRPDDKAPPITPIDAHRREGKSLVNSVAPDVAARRATESAAEKTAAIEGSTEPKPAA